MKFSLSLASLKPEVTLSHGKEFLVFSVATFAKETLNNDYDIFQHLNSYWESLSKDKQNEIFAVFKRIRFAFDDSDLLDRDKITHKLTELVSELYWHHPLEDARKWIIFKSDIHIPDILRSEYVVNNDQPGSREQTYLREEYIELITYALLTRLMFPIWGEFIARTKQDAGTTFKEYYAYMLLTRTALMNCKAAVKLKEYIESNAPEEPPSSAIIGGVSSEDYPIWILSLVVIRRVCIGDIRGMDTTSPYLVKYIYNFIVQKIQGSETNFANIGKVSVKTLDMSGGDEDDSSGSRFESYKIREDITIGDRAFLLHGMKDIPGIVKKICPDINAQMVHNAFVTSKVLESHKLNDAQITLARWIFKSVISPRAFVYFTKPIIVQSLAASQCILWHWGYKDLAMLVTARPFEDRVNRSVRITNSDIKKFLPTINELYPYVKRIVRNPKDKTGDQVIVAINTMADLFSENDWVTTIEDDLFNDETDETKTKLFSTPTNIKARLAQLIVEHIAKLNKNHPNSILV